MSNKTNKPKLSPHQLIDKMRDEKGITFKHISEEDAETFLAERNNYIRTASYRKAYEKYTMGQNAGKYIGLDFGHLKELSIIDMHYRFLVEQMCSDIEHSLCVKINSLVANDSTTDGYDIVYNYLSARPNTVATIEKAISSPHTGNLIKKYFTVQTSRDAQTGIISNRITAFDDCPVWILTEVMTFGDIIHFYKDYFQSRNVQTEPTEALHLVRSLRNAAAHNNCLLADLRSGSTIAPQVLSNAVSQLGTVTNSQRRKKLSCRSVLEFVALIYEYDHLVLDKVREHRVKQLDDLFYKRMLDKKEYFVSNDLLRTTYEFSVKIIQGFL